MAYEVPDVTVEQIFTKQNPTLLAPDLPVVLVGPAYQIEYRTSGGEYDGTAVSIPYPELKTGAVVDTNTVEVLFSTDYGLFEVTNFSADSDSVDIDASIELDIRTIENSQTGQTNGVFFTDDNVNFFTAFGAVTNSPSITISSPSDNQKTFDVVAITDSNNVIIKEQEDGVVRDFTSFSTYNSVTTTFVDAGNGSSTNPISVREFVVGDIALTISLSTTYSMTATVIDGESSINQETDIIVGDYIYFDTLGKDDLKRIDSIDSSTGAVTLNEALGATIGLSTSYKVFHPVLVKNQTLNTSGDYVVAKDASNSSRMYFGEISTIVGLNTITTATGLTDVTSFLNTTGWVGGDTYAIYRGALSNTNSNIYDAFKTLISYEAGVLVSYKALRTDLSSDWESITGIDDVETILDNQTPDNPLGLAAKITASASNNLFYVMGTDGDTTAAHQAALEVLEAKEVYYMVPLSQNLSVLALYKNHVESMSLPSAKMERTAFINRDIYISGAVSISTTTNKMLAGTDTTSRLVLGMVNQFNAIATLSGTAWTQSGIGYQASVGDTVFVLDENDQSSTITAAEITSVGAALNYLGLSTVLTASIGDAVQVVSEQSLTTIATNGNGAFTTLSVGDNIDLLDVNGDVEASSVVQAKSTNTVGTFTRKYLDLETSLGASLNYKNFNATTAPLSKLEQAQFIRDYAKSIQSRRVVHVYAPQATQVYSPVSAPTTEVTATLPGYYLSAFIAGRKSNEAPSQPFTNLNMGISTQLFYINDYFKPEYLDVIAEGGNWIMVQANTQSLPYSRHQMTTDVTSIETTEFSITTALDWFAKFMRSQLRPYIGRFNITSNYLAQLKTVANAVKKKTVDDLGYLADTTKILKVFQSATQPDEVYVDVNADVLYPANNIRVRIYI